MAFNFKKSSDKAESGIENDILYSNQFMNIVMINPNYPFLKMKKNGVVTVPYDSEGNIYILKKFRPHVGLFLELPRGFVEDAEAFESGALRELLEETGMVASKVTCLGDIQADTGIVTQKVKLYAILVDKIDNKEHYDEADNETNKVLRLTLDEFDNELLSGSVVDNYTIGGVHYFKLVRKRGIL